MTYGWMLLVVAVIGGAILSFGEVGCPETVSGFAGDSVTVDDFGSTSTDKIQFELKNNGGDEVNLKEIRFTQNGKTLEIGSSRKIESFESEVFSTDGLVETSSCNNVEVQIVYDVGALEGVGSTGTLTTSGKVLDLTPDTALPENDLQMRFDAQTIGYTDGKEIDKWIDLTNGQNNATGIDDSRLPEVNSDGINGYQALKFEPGPEDILTMSDKPYLKSRNHTIFAVVRFNDVSGRTAVTSKYEPGSRINTLQVEDNKTWLNWNDNGGWKNVNGSENVSTDPAMLSTRVGDNITGYVGGNKDVTRNIVDPLSLNSGPVSFGAVKCPGCGDYWELDGNIGEIIYYNRTLSDSEMDGVHSYLSEKWDLN